MGTFFFIPSFLALWGLPIISDIAAAGVKKGVKRTLANVEDVIYYVRIFLLFASVVIVILLMIWGIRWLIRRRHYRKVREIITLLHRIQSDLSLLQEGEALPKEYLLDISLSKKEAIGMLRSLISHKFFKARIGPHAYQRMEDTFSLIEDDKMSFKNQSVLITQWIRTIDLLCR